MGFYQEPLDGKDYCVPVNMQAGGLYAVCHCVRVVCAAGLAAPERLIQPRTQCWGRVTCCMQSGAFQGPVAALSCFVAWTCTAAVCSGRLHPLCAVLALRVESAGRHVVVLC